MLKMRLMQEMVLIMMAIASEWNFPEEMDLDEEWVLPGEEVEDPRQDDHSIEF